MYLFYRLLHIYFVVNDIYIYISVYSGAAEIEKEKAEDQYQMFQVMMDGFESERDSWSKKHHDLQVLLQQATSVSIL